MIECKNVERSEIPPVRGLNDKIETDCRPRGKAGFALLAIVCWLE